MYQQKNSVAKRLGK